MGLFKQVFEGNKQKETPNPWIEPEGWLTDAGISFQVPFKDFTLTSKLYDIDVAGYQNGRNKLHLFDVEGVDESIIGDGISFDKHNIQKNLTLFLYPETVTRREISCGSISSISWFLPVLSLFSTNVLHVDVTIMTLLTMQLSRSMIHIQVW